jgi:hypothetical protein
LGETRNTDPSNKGPSLVRNAAHSKFGLGLTIVCVVSLNDSVEAPAHGVIESP